MSPIIEFVIPKYGIAKDANGNLKINPQFQSIVNNAKKIGIDLCNQTLLEILDKNGLCNIVVHESKSSQMENLMEGMPSETQLDIDEENELEEARREFKRLEEEIDKTELFKNKFLKIVPDNDQLDKIELDDMKNFLKNNASLKSQSAIEDLKENIKQEK